MAATLVKVMPNGRMSLPSDIRKRLGLSGGGTILVDETDEGVMLRTTAQAVAHAQALSRAIVGDKPAGSVDDFIEDRRPWQD